MIGGNGYAHKPTAELIVRWTQANALMPAMQFGYLPWDYPSDSVSITFSKSYLFYEFSWV